MNARALAVGILVGMTLVVAYEFLGRKFSEAAGPPGYSPVLSASNAVFPSVLISLLYAVQIVLVCLPIWILLKRIRWDGPYAAGSLGFVATLVLWTMSNQPLIPNIDDLAYAICGGLAGIVAWWARPKYKSAEHKNPLS